MFWYLYLFYNTPKKISARLTIIRTLLLTMYMKKLKLEIH